MQKYGLFRCLGATAKQEERAGVLEWQEKSVKWRDLGSRGDRCLSSRYHRSGLLCRRAKHNMQSQLFTSPAALLLYAEARFIQTRERLRNWKWNERGGNAATMGHLRFFGLKCLFVDMRLRQRGRQKVLLKYYFSEQTCLLLHDNRQTFRKNTQYEGTIYNTMLYNCVMWALERFRLTVWCINPPLRLFTLHISLYMDSNVSLFIFLLLDRKFLGGLIFILSLETFNVNHIDQIVVVLLFCTCFKVRDECLGWVLIKFYDDM